MRKSNKIFKLKIFFIDNLLYVLSKPEERKVRERVLKLMKSDVIRLNDVNYMRDLSEKLQETIKVRNKYIGVMFYIGLKLFLLRKNKR